MAKLQKPNNIIVVAMLNMIKQYYRSANAKYDLKDYYGAIADYTKAIELNGTCGTPKLKEATNNYICKFVPTYLPLSIAFFAFFGQIL